MRWRHLTILGWMALFLVLVEVGLELRAKGRGWETLLFEHEAPAAPQKPTAGDAPAYGPTAAFPYRSRVITKAHNGKTRIWIASASYALGSNVGVDRIFPVLLERQLREAGHDVEVINGGLTGLSVKDSTTQVLGEAAAYKPDIVVLYQMSTDIDELTRRILAPEVAAREDAEGEDGGPWFNPRLWLEFTTTYPILKSQISARVTRERVLCRSLGDEGEARFEARIEAFLDAVASIGAQPVLCTFAVSHERDHPDDLPLHVYRFNIRLAREGWHDSLDRWNRRLRAVAAVRSVPVADVRAAVSGKTDHFVDFVHFDEQGHARVADALLPVLREVLKAGAGR